MPKPIHVFISYSHDSDTHIHNVVSFANDLRSHGIDAHLDRFVESPPEGWPRWVAHEIADADFVVCVCTVQYRVSFEGRNDPQKGLGVNQEGFLIYQDLYDNGNQSKRYIPVTFGRVIRRETIPGTLRAFTSYELPNEYEQLFRRVTSQPEKGLTRYGYRSELLPQAPSQPALASLAEKSAGNDRQGELTEFLTPTQYPVEKLAPHDGLYLSRLINPQQRTVHDLITTVWVTARGPLDYVIDSIRIRDVLYGGLGGNPVVTLTPDAEYRFTYTEGSDRIHALNPALAVGPSTRNRAWFTLGTAMEVGFYYVGNLLIWVQYQASDGSTGTLFLAETPADGWELAKLVGVDVEFPIQIRDGGDFGQLVITPEGVQRGFESQYPPECRYVPFPKYAGFGPDRDRLLRTRAQCAEALQLRGPLNQALKDDAKRDKLKHWLEQGWSLAADLLGGMADEKSTAILVDEFRKSHSNSALTGLRVRHVAIGDKLLADIAHENQPALSDAQLESILSTFALRPAGAWVEILIRHQKSAAETVQHILAAMEPELAIEDRFRILAAPGGPLARDLFVRGTMNNWTAPDNAKFVYHGDGKYKVTLALDAGNHEFKIGDTTWWNENVGGRHEGLRITIDEDIELFNDRASHNLHLNLPDPGDYTFTLNANNFSKLLLRIKRGSVVSS